MRTQFQILISTCVIKFLLEIFLGNTLKCMNIRTPFLHLDSLIKLSCDLFSCSSVPPSFPGSKSNFPTRSLPISPQRRRRRRRRRRTISVGWLCHASVPVCRKREREREREKRNFHPTKSFFGLEQTGRQCSTPQIPSPIHKQVLALWNKLELD